MEAANAIPTILLLFAACLAATLQSTRHLIHNLAQSFCFLALAMTQQRSSKDAQEGRDVARKVIALQAKHQNEDEEKSRIVNYQGLRFYQREAMT
jgi:hypothetical protein